MKRATLLLWGGVCCSLMLLLLLLRKIDLQGLAQALARLDLRCLAGAVLLTFVSYWLRAVRWRFLLIHLRPLPLASLYPATIIGYMANNLFPARLGEFVRAWVLAEREQLPAAGVFASLVIDRLFDGLSVMVMLALVLMNLRLPPGMEQAAMLLKTGGMAALLVYLAAMAILVLLKRWPASALSLLNLLLKPLPPSFGQRLSGAAESFMGGVRLSVRPSDMGMILGSSLLIWISATLPIHLILLGFGVQLPLTASFFIMVLLVFAVMVPAAPGYIGTYHLACYTGLAAFGLPDTQAVSIALVVHGVGFFPVIAAGLCHAWFWGLSLGAMRHQAAEQESQV